MNRLIGYGLVMPALVFMVNAAANASELAGTAWRLVNIASMDDRSFTPAEPERYTLEFNVDGTVVVLADCNRGRGDWASGSPGQLRFGPLATTRAKCPPESLSDRFLDQFPWVRSYVLREGHLYLATMADGSIVELEPLGPAAEATATLLGEELRTGDAAELSGAILSRLFDRYAAEHDIEAKRDEIDTYLDHLRQGLADAGLDAADDLTAEEAAMLETMQRDMAAGMIRQWKINKSLFDTYGGRIIYQQLGPEPLDAYREFLRERNESGDFVINDPALSEAFWRYFNDESMHVFMEPGGPEARRAFSIPPWQEPR